MEKCKFSALVAVEAATYAIDKPYEYIIPDELKERVVPGIRVRVNFGRGNRRTEAIVLDVHPVPCDVKVSLKPIAELIDDTPVLDEKLIKLALWLREQCFCTFFDVARAMLPSGVWHKFDITYLPVDGSEYDEAINMVASIENGREIADSIFKSTNPCKKSDIDNSFGLNNVKKVVSLLLKKELISISENIKKNISDKTERLVRLSVSKERIAEYTSKKGIRPAVLESIRKLEEFKAISVKELCYFTGITISQLNTLKKNQIIEFDEVEVYRRPRAATYAKKEKITLNHKQNDVYDNIVSDIGSGPVCSLLYGVTGSGKTLIYFKLIEKVISMKKTALLLVPEISLTPQLLAQVYAYFGERTAVMHSALSVGERYDEWKRIRNGEVDVVVGTRSAIFSPLSNIGIIILDEEQEDTYKSSSNPRYHAREVAKYRCVADSALLLLGSATPSVESMYNAKIGKYKLNILPERFNEHPLPSVIISDLRKSFSCGSDAVIGKELLEELRKNIECGEQSILFLNRRGSSKYVVCDDCEEVPGCPNCSVPLVYHSKNSRLMCHHCGYSKRIEEQCSQCGGKMKFVGFGTQRVEQELSELFPGVKVLRMDLDTTSGKSSHEKILNTFRNENIPILLGTQMITKGLDFENVTLVGVLAADQAIFNENFKAAENAFSLMTQVVGRSGRGRKIGRAVIQTYSPNNSVVVSAAKQDYDMFFKNELTVRESCNLPPFSDVFSLVVMAMDEMSAFDACVRLRDKTKAVLGKEYSDIYARVLGPSPASIVKVNGKFRYKLLICTKNSKRSRDMISRLVRDFSKDKQNKDMSIIPDINSTDF